MSIKSSVLPNFVRSFLFIALAGFSFSALAYNHGDGEEKAAAKVEEAMQDKDAAMKEKGSDYVDGEHDGMESADMSEAEEAVKEEADAIAPE